MSMAEAPTPAVGAPGTGARSYAKAARRVAGGSASEAGANPSKTAQQLKQSRLEWLGRRKAPAAPAEETMTPSMAPNGEPQETEASSASDSAQEVPSSPEVADTEDTKSAGASSPSGVSNIMESNSLLPAEGLTRIDEGAGPGSSQDLAPQDFAPRAMNPGEPGYIGTGQPGEPGYIPYPGEAGYEPQFGEKREGRKAGSWQPLDQTDLAFVALTNEDPARQPIVTPEDITTTVDIDFHAVQLDIPIEQMAAMADR